MPVRVVTDSTSDIPQADAASLGLTVVPLNIHAGSRQFRDGVDIQPQEFFRRLAASKLTPKTSQPAAGVFQEVYEGLAADGSEILSVHISAKLSGTLNSASTARDALAGRTRIEIVDSGTVSGGLAMGARLAAEAAAAGASLDECARVAREAFARTEVMMVLDTLEYLQRGGRIGRARAWFGGMLNIKPVLAVREGEVVPVERVRSRARAEERLFELVGENPRRERLGIWHSGSDEDGERWAERLRALLPGVPVEVGLLGPVVGVYGGPQTLGIAMLNRADGA